MTFTIDPTRNGYHWSVKVGGQVIEGTAPTETAAMRAIARAEAGIDTSNPAGQQPAPVTPSKRKPGRDLRRSED